MALPYGSPRKLILASKFQFRDKNWVFSGFRQVSSIALYLPHIHHKILSFSVSLIIKETRFFITSIQAFILLPEWNYYFINLNLNLEIQAYAWFCLKYFFDLLYLPLYMGLPLRTLGIFFSALPRKDKDSHCRFAIIL